MSFTLNYTGDEINAILARANNGGEIDDELVLKAPLASPALTGTPTAPTQAEGDDSTKIATTKYADRAADAAGAAAEAAAKEYTDEATSALYITDTASGSIASFSDGADGVPMRSVKVAITPVQSGSGDPSPDNIRPISGWTGAEVTRTGVNVWDEETELGGFDADGNKTNVTNQLRTKNPIMVIPGKSYYASHATRYRFYDRNNVQFSSTLISAGGVITVPEGTAYMLFGLGSGYGTTYNHDISVNYPSSDHDYHTYAGQTFPVTWESEAGTVYGGTIDVVSGELKVTSATISYASSDGFSAHSSDRWYKGGGLPSGMDSTKRAQSISNQAKYQDSPNTYGALFAYGGSGIYINKLVASETISDFSSRLTANPFQVVYELATPVTYILTPQQITSLLGQNNVWSNTGDIEVTYVADPKLYIAKMLGGGTLTLESVSPLSVNRPVTISEEDLEQAGEVSEAVEEAVETVPPAESGETEEEA